DAADGDPVAGHLGGDPQLPVDAPWPADPDGAPMEHLLSLDLAALPRTGLDLPESGTLQFFRSPDCTHGEVRHVPDDTPTEPRTPPAALGRAPGRVDVAAVVVPTLPGFAHRIVRGELDEYLDLPHIPVDHEMTGGTVHQLGGYGEGVQYEPDFAPDSSPMTVPVDGDPATIVELPVLLAQIDTDDESGIGWGDSGNSHWVIDREDLAARRFAKTRLIWSCF
ncbi:MAG TPA: YwqG family protein, partial [Phytomonospora sp.]